ncbi:MAG: Trp family transcriptional regulator [candidate division WOR-3 bacterium]
MKQKITIKKYLAWKLLKEGKTFREISKKLNISIATISRIKKSKNFFNFDKKAYKIYLYVERYPFKNLSYLSKKFKMPISTIYNKLSLYDVYGLRERKEISELVKYLFENKDFKNLRKVLKHFIPSSQGDYEILINIPNELLPINLLSYKFSYIYSKIYHTETVIITLKELLYNIRVYKLRALKERMFLSYYSLFIPEIMVLRALGKYDEIKLIFKTHYKKFLKLPDNLKKSILLLILNSLYFELYVYQKLFPILSRWLKHKKILKDSNLSKVAHSILVSLGYIKRAYNVFKVKSLIFYLGDFNNFLKSSDNTIYDRILKCICYLLNGNYQSFISQMGILEITFQSREFNDENYKLALAFERILKGDIEKAKKIIINIQKKTYLALLNKDTSLLIKHRKQDLIAKYIIKSNIKRAYKLALKYGLIANFLIYLSIKNLKIYSIKNLKNSHIPYIKHIKFSTT